MSNYLAIATVTTVLRDILQEAAGAAVPGATVTTRRPEAINDGGQNKPVVNIFLYGVTPNAALRNADLPTRNTDGGLARYPQAALDLHYLLSFYGAELELIPQRMLGRAISALHAQPLLSPDKIRRVIGITHKTKGQSGYIGESNLDEQIDRVRFSPLPLNLEELSKLWSVFFQVPYALSVAYQASVVLIEADKEMPQSALPVLTRGPEDRGTAVSPDLTPPFPTLLAVTPPNQQPSVRLGEELILRGYNLLGEPGDGIEVMAKHPRMPTAEDLKLQGDPTATEIHAVPDDPDSFPTGNYVLMIRYMKNGKQYRTTNQLPFSLAPKLTNPSAKRAPGGKVTLKVRCSPHVWQGQRASLLLNEREAIAGPFKGDKTDTLTFTFEDIPAREYWLRLRVDGVESQLVNRAVTPPVFDATQRITIP